MTVTSAAAAKINLYLHVAAPRADGYHPLDSLVTFARDVADVVSAEPADGLAMEVTGPFAPALAGEADNLVLRAARLLAQNAGVTAGAQLRLQKNLPIASGIGGGSADAAAALRVLNRLWRVGADERDLEILAVQLGADVPVCVRSRTARMCGIGEELAEVTAPDLGAVLVNPGVATETGGIFRAFDALASFAELAPQSPAPMDLAPMDSGRFLDWLGRQRNDLEASARREVPTIASTLDMLREAAPGALVRMSGSGATCLVLTVPGEESALAAWISRRRPDWWVRATGLGNADAAVLERTASV